MPPGDRDEARESETENSPGPTTKKRARCFQRPLPRNEGNANNCYMLVLLSARWFSGASERSCAWQPSSRRACAWQLYFLAAFFLAGLRLAAFFLAAFFLAGLRLAAFFLAAFFLAGLRLAAALLLGRLLLGGLALGSSLTSWRPSSCGLALGSSLLLGGSSSQALRLAAAFLAGRRLAAAFLLCGLLLCSHGSMLFEFALNGGFLFWRKCASGE